MKFELILEDQFKEDYKELKREHAWLISYLRAAIKLLAENGELPSEYNDHLLDNPGGNYNGHNEFHLADGVVDVLVLYKKRETHLTIRLVRIGTHDQLFHGPLR